MDYIIKNKKNVYIRLNGEGKPVPCGENKKTLFTYQKAKNITDSLPKTLRRLNFSVVAIPDVINPKSGSKKKVIKSENYVQSDGVTNWINKFGICEEIISEARKRKEELISNLSNIDKKMTNELHKIELEPWKNACA